ncbi:hypothetical protein NFI96_009278 [Prochilodus magdalenae]|nr:hypothetical protein NFI96_009278 [Prochilodus magdalenae]
MEECSDDEGVGGHALHPSQETVWSGVFQVFFLTVCADQIGPDQETDVLKTEGEPLTLRCTYETSSQNIWLYWYRHIVDNKVIVRARCYRSMRKNEEPHKLEVIHGLPVGFYSRLFPGESLLFQTLTAYEGGRKMVPLKPSGNSTRFQPRASLYVVCSSEVPAAHNGGVYSVSPLDTEKQVSVGDSVTLSCIYSSSDVYRIHWYHQYPPFNLDLILSIYESGSISPLEEKVDAVEGQTVTLSCSYKYRSGDTPSLHWYSQYPGTRPEFLLLKYQGSASVTHADPPYPRLNTKDNGSVVDLEISSAAVSDSVLYYCALAPTVTGNPDTLYRNWFYD